MAIGYNPSANPAMSRVQAVNYQNPNSLLSALQGITPDYNYGMHQSTISGLGGAAGTDKTGSGGGGFGGGFSIGGGGEQYGTSGQAAKIGALGGAAGQSIANAGTQNRFNQALGFLNSHVGNNGGSAGLKGEVNINAAPIWNENQIQARVNQMRGQNDARAASSLRQTNSGLAGRGMGGQSPLMQALGSQNAMATMAANSGGENDLRWNAAQGNAQQVLQAQQAQAQQRAQMNQALDQQFATKSGYWKDIFGGLFGR